MRAWTTVAFVFLGCFDVGGLSSGEDAAIEVDAGGQDEGESADAATAEDASEEDASSAVDEAVPPDEAVPSDDSAEADGIAPTDGAEADATVTMDALVSVDLLSRRPPPGGLVGYWPLDGVAAVEPDASGSGNNLTVTSAGSVVGRVGSARRMNGTTSCLASPRAPALDMTGGRAFSVMAWVLPRVCPPQNDSAVVSKTGEYALHVHCGSALVAEECATTTDPGWTTHGSVSVTIGAWHHLAVTWDGALVRQYVDGAEVGVPRAMGGALDPTFALGAPYGFGVGCGNVPPTGVGTVAYEFTGDIDEVALYSRALMGTEIAAYYAATM